MARVITPTAAYARDVSVTWWYTASSILFLHAFAAVTWTIGVFAEGAPTALVLNLLGVAGSLASAVLLLVRYRREPLDDADVTARRPMWPLVVSGIVAAAAMGM